VFSFIDISGDVRSKDNNYYVVAAAATINNEHISSLINKIHSLKRDCLDNETLEIKSTEFVNKNTLENSNLRKHAFIERFIKEILIEFKFSAVIMRNTPIEKYFNREILPAHYIFLMQRINKIAEIQKKQVLVIIDNEARCIDRWTAFAFNNYLFRSSGGKKLLNIVEMPIFADSEMTQGLQVADIAAGIIKRYYDLQLNMGTAPKTEYENKIVEYYAIIARHAPNNSNYVGLYEAPDDFIRRNFGIDNN